MMGRSPVALREKFSFFFYSNDRGEPPHVHVRTGSGMMKFWLTPTVRLAKKAKGVSRQDERKALHIVRRNRPELLERRYWRDGMPFSHEARSVRATPKFLVLTLADSRTIRAPWGAISAKLSRAVHRDRACLELLPGGTGIHWPSLDEHLSVAGILRDVQ
jgi:Domain of unknown function (DUF4160)/Protein of unknown function (DUF2442)